MRAGRLLLLGVIMVVIAGGALDVSGPRGEPDWSGFVEVVDGDTLRTPERVRMVGLDAPEAEQVCYRDGQPWRCGEAATKRLRELTQGKDVHCVFDGRDRYQRLLGRCSVDGRDLTRRMILDGLAVAEWGTALDDAAELWAITTRAGMWRGEFVRPVEYRRRVRNGALDPSRPH